MRSFWRRAGHMKQHSGVARTRPIDDFGKGLKAHSWPKALPRSTETVLVYSRSSPFGIFFQTDLQNTL